MNTHAHEKAVTDQRRQRHSDGRVALAYAVKYATSVQIQIQCLYWTTTLLIMTLSIMDDSILRGIAALRHKETSCRWAAHNQSQLFIIDDHQEIWKATVQVHIVPPIHTFYTSLRPGVLFFLDLWLVCN